MWLREGGGNCLKYLKRGWNGGGTEKRGGKTMILKRGSQLSQGVGALKKGEGGLEPPYELC